MKSIRTIGNTAARRMDAIVVVPNGETIFSERASKNRDIPDNLHRKTDRRSGTTGGAESGGYRESMKK